MTNPRRLRVWALLLVLAAALLFFPVRYGLKQIWALTTYEPVEAIITDVKVIARPAKYDSVFEPRVNYEFEVDGRIYTGARLRFGPYASRHKRTAEELAMLYKPGQPVTVYVNREDPTQSFIERDIFWVPYLAIAVILAILWYFHWQAMKKVTGKEREEMADRPSESGE